MSKINIQGIIDNIRNKSNVYTPIIEAIVNSIQAIQEKKTQDGLVEVILIRENILEFSGSLPSINNIIIRDNGVGFNDQNRDSFDTYYSEVKKEIGGKGFGRFLFAKYFDTVRVESVFETKDGKNKLRKFRFGKGYEIVVDEKIEDTDVKETYSSIFLNDLKESHSFEKDIETISKRILEKILIYFINDSANCPTIVVKENDGSNSIVLNDYLKGKNQIQLFKEIEFSVNGSKPGAAEKFTAKVFKIYYPGHQRSKLSLTGHSREVTEVNLHRYIPEFADDFFDEDPQTKVKKNYIIKTYVLGKYLDENVSVERETFYFPKSDDDIYFCLSQVDIESGAAKVTQGCFEEEVSVRSEKKEKKIREYVNSNAPWHKPYLKELDLSKIPYGVGDEDIEVELQKLKFNKEISTRAELARLMTANDDEFESKLSAAVSSISEIGKSDLVHYVCTRKLVLEMFAELLKRREDGKGELEKDIHNVIFPQGKDSETCDYHDHNLWLLDERLVFSEYVASDKKISTKKDALKEPDLLVFDKKRSFRNGDNELSNALTIFEFKRPKRTAYKDEEDPIVQIGGYLDDIRAGKYDMPEGSEKVKVGDTTPVYGYIICDPCERITDFARRHQLTISSDQEGYFGYHSGYRMYIEIISFKKLLKDANLRNKIFFKKLQIE